jgi:hypothetical protein
MDEEVPFPTLRDEDPDANDNSNATTMQEDNPCWGSPTECDLSHLLAHYRKEDCLVSQPSPSPSVPHPHSLRLHPSPLTLLNPHRCMKVPIISFSTNHPI